MPELLPHTLTPLPTSCTHPPLLHPPPVIGHACHALVAAGRLGSVVQEECSQAVLALAVSCCHLLPQHPLPPDRTALLLYRCTAGIGPYITEPDTPVAAMWQEQFGSKDKKQHMKDMFELTTRVNALVRIATGNVNIAATTALQVRSGASP